MYRLLEHNQKKSVFAFFILTLNRKNDTNIKELCLRADPCFPISHRKSTKTQQTTGTQHTSSLSLYSSSSSMAAARRPSAILAITSLVFIIIFFLFPIFFQLPYAEASHRSLLAVAENQNQRQQKNNKTNQNRSCSEIVNQSDCKSKPKCRWCRSNVLDDMCASKLEAWRLPSQVFSCGL